MDIYKAGCNKQLAFVNTLYTMNLSKRMHSYESRDLHDFGKSHELVFPENTNLFRICDRICKTELIQITRELKSILLVNIKP